MRWIRENKGSAAVLALAAIAMVVLVALLLVQGLDSDAEAVLGAPGNLGDLDPDHPHNLAGWSTGVRATGENEICIFCHTPHHAMVKAGSGAPIINAPLWNHELSDLTYTVWVQNLTAYYNGTLVANIPLLTAVTNKPDGASRLCLSCHDGTVSIGAVYSSYKSPSNLISMVDACIAKGGGETAGLGFDSKGRFGNLTSSCMAFIGTNLRSKHVVSVAMNQSLIDAANANCTAPGTATMRLRYPWDGGEPNRVLLRPTAEKFDSSPGVTYPTGSMPANKYKSGYNYGVQCSTCHDPHYWIETVGQLDTEGEKLLVKYMVGASPTLCEVCHYNCP
jgi:hypothetical protein